jgi:hypothetical protein
VVRRPNCHCRRYLLTDFANIQLSPPPRRVPAVESAAAYERLPSSLHRRSLTGDTLQPTHVVEASRSLPSK